jgi:hypothetical protein
MLYLLEIRFLCRTLAQRDVIFQELLPWLEKRSGKNCRALVGKWLSEIRDDDAIRQLLESKDYQLTHLDKEYHYFQIENYKF